VIIHKFTHSCLYIEDEGISFLFDPGTYTSNEKSLDVDNIPSLDYLLITHEHADHFDINLIRKITDKFPDAKILTNPSVQNLLSNENIDSSSQEEKMLLFRKAAHERVLGPEVENWTMTIGEKIFNPGDSYQFNSTKEVLILPIQAPWGHMVRAVKKAEQVKPKYVIPVHDWHWKKEARQALYEQAAHSLKKNNIIFITNINEKPFEL
jgi:L-ascorbate metabolism protein UlaG (beta-lactamase superfamily)